MSHCITFVDGNELPEGHDFLVVKFPIGAHVFLRRAALTEAVLEDCWAAYRALAKRRPERAPTCDCEAPVLSLSQRAV